MQELVSLSWPWTHIVTRTKLQVSFGSILTPVGASLLAYGFGAYFSLLPGASSAAILLIYGFPMTLLGFALTYAQLKPVPCKTTPEALQQREAQCTDIQKSVGLRMHARCQLRQCLLTACCLCLLLRAAGARFVRLLRVQVREDVTRYRYGDEQHLDEALNRVFMLGRPKGLPRRCCTMLCRCIWPDPAV